MNTLAAELELAPTLWVEREHDTKIRKAVASLDLARAKAYMKVQLAAIREEMLAEDRKLRDRERAKVLDSRERRRLSQKKYRDRMRAVRQEYDRKRMEELRRSNGQEPTTKKCGYCGRHGHFRPRCPILAKKTRPKPAPAPERPAPRKPVKGLGLLFGGGGK
jgi:hypothetical protein